MPRPTQPQMSTVEGNGILMPDASNSTDVSYHAVRAYYDIHSQMRKQHPGLIFEICNGTAAGWWTSAAPRMAIISP